MLTMPTSHRRQLIVLLVVLLSAYAINLDTTIVNVALPTLNLRLGAGTSSLQWVVDGYNLAFAALVLAGGNVGDRYGRRETLSVGLGGFAVASLLAALCTNVSELIAARFAMGAAASLIYPTTLSIITNTFSDRTARAAAIGAWGGVTGLGVATGPIVGGVLLEHFWWGSVFVALIPVAAAALAGAWLFVPHSRQDGLAPLDRVGLGLSVVALGALIYTIIEAPGHGWASARSIAGFAAAAAVGAVFVRWERGRDAPMLDVRLFANLRFSAASLSVTVAFFSLFGFIFLITQYFQQLRGYGPLSTGVRILPVAFSIAISSVLGSKLVVRAGNKAVAAAGLLCLAASFLRIGLSASLVSYDLIVAEMVLMGAGLGLTSTAATESIMGVVRPEQAGAGSAVNDATREIGGTLGVAVLGSVYASLYASHLRSHSGGLPPALVQKAVSSFGSGRAVADRLGGAPGIAFGHAVTASFMDGLHAACFVAGAICVLGAAFVAGLLPSRPASPIPALSEWPASPRPGAEVPAASAGGASRSVGRLGRSAVAGGRWPRR
jgi:EmrB/QacA subfamily drug resistance transporter